jgi:hypothetical protein
LLLWEDLLHTQTSSGALRREKIKSLSFTIA